MTKTITCPRCGARAHWENEDQTFEFSTPGLIGRILRPHHYQQTAAPPWDHTQPVINVQQPSPSLGTPLNPGETVWRTLDERADIRPQLRMGLTCAGFVVVAGACVAVGVSVKGTWPYALIVGLGDLAACVVFVRLNWDLLGWGDGIDRLVSRKRESDTQPTIEIGEKRHLVTLHIEDGQGGHRFLNDINVTPQLKEFARRVLIESVSFSERGASECDVEKPDFVNLRDQMLDRGLIAWKNVKNTRSGYKWRGGREALKTLAEFPLSET